MRVYLPMRWPYPVDVAACDVRDRLRVLDVDTGRVLAEYSWAGGVDLVIEPGTPVGLGVLGMSGVHVDTPDGSALARRALPGRLHHYVRVEVERGGEVISSVFTSAMPELE